MNVFDHFGVANRYIHQLKDLEKNYKDAQKRAKSQKKSGGSSIKSAPAGGGAGAQYSASPMRKPLFLAH